MWSVQFNNALPDPGGIRNQYALVMESLAVVRDEVRKVEDAARAEEHIKSEAKRTADKSKRGPRT
jgi:hypothetical protein